MGPRNIQEYFEECIYSDRSLPPHIEEINSKTVEFLNVYQKSRNSMERKKLVVVLSIILKYNRLSYSMLKEKKLAYIIQNKMFICHGDSSKQDIDYSQLRAREPDHVSDPLFFTMPMSQFPYGLVIPFSQKRIESMWNNNELEKLPDPQKHFIWIATKGGELKLIQGGESNDSSSNNVSLSLMSISYEDVPSDCGQKVGLKKKAKRDSEKETEYLDISFDKEINISPQNPRKKPKPYNNNSNHKSFNCFKSMEVKSNNARRMSGVLGSKMEEIIKDREEKERLFVIKRGKKRKVKKRKSTYMTQTSFERKHNGSEDIDTSFQKSSSKKNQAKRRSMKREPQNTGEQNQSFKNLFQQVKKRQKKSKIQDHLNNDNVFSNIQQLRDSNQFSGSNNSSKLFEQITNMNHNSSSTHNKSSLFENSVGPSNLKSENSAFFMSRDRRFRTVSRQKLNQDSYPYQNMSNGSLKKSLKLNLTPANKRSFIKNQQSEAKEKKKVQKSSNAYTKYFKSRETFSMNNLPNELNYFSNHRQERFLKSENTHLDMSELTTDHSTPNGSQILAKVTKPKPYEQFSRKSSGSRSRIKISRRKVKSKTITNLDEVDRTMDQFDFSKRQRFKESSNKFKIKMKPLFASTLKLIDRSNIDQSRLVNGKFYTHKKQKLIKKLDQCVERTNLIYKKNKQKSRQYL